MHYLQVKEINIYAMYKTKYVTDDICFEVNYIKSVTYVQK